MLMFDRTVHLGEMDYDVEPFTGFAYSTNPESQLYACECPRLPGPGFAPPDQHFMRDPTLVTTWRDTGGTTIEAASSFRSLVRPWSGQG